MHTVIHGAVIRFWPAPLTRQCITTLAALNAGYTNTSFSMFYLSCTPPSFLMLLANSPSHHSPSHHLTPVLLALSPLSSPTVLALCSCPLPPVLSAPLLLPKSLTPDFCCYLLLTLSPCPSHPLNPASFILSLIFSILPPSSSPSSSQSCLLHPLPILSILPPSSSPPSSQSCLPHSLPHPLNPASLILFPILSILPPSSSPHPLNPASLILSPTLSILPPSSSPPPSQSCLPHSLPHLLNPATLILSPLSFPLLFLSSNLCPSHPLDPAPLTAVLLATGLLSIPCPPRPPPCLRWTG